MQLLTEKEKLLHGSTN
jgi:hypothetical protein